jgi:predicted membrane protein
MHKRLIVVVALVFGLSFALAVPASADTATTTCGAGAVVSSLAGPSFGPFASGLATTTSQPGLTIVVPIATTCSP